MSAPARRLLRSLATNHPASRCATGECPCCLALRTARERTLFDSLPEWRSPLTPGVQRVNLTGSEAERTLYVALGHNWARMLAQLPQVGRALVMTRNAAVILGRRMIYPEFELTSDGSKGANGQASLWVDFRRLAMARAVHRRCDAGHIFGVEFADEEGRIVHRFTLTPESHYDAFFEWVRLHQACTIEDDRWEDLESAAPLAEAVRPERRSDAGAVAAVLAACREQQLPVQAIVAGHGVRHGATLTPTSIHREGSWWFISDEWAGVHFDPELLSHVEIVEWRTAASAASHLALRCSSEEMDGVLVLAPATDTPADEWRSVLQTLA